MLCKKAFPESQPDALVVMGGSNRGVQFPRKENVIQFKTNVESMEWLGNSILEER